MMPAMRQRLLILATTLVASLLWLWPARWLIGPDGSSGIALSSAHSGLLTAGLLIVAASLPVLLLAMLVSSAGHPAAGVFVLTASLTVLAALGGPMDGWLRRADLPGDYVHLLGESLLWAAGLALALLLLHRARALLRGNLGVLVSQPHEGADETLMLSIRGVPAMLTCAAASSVLAHLLIRTSDGGQVIGGLMLSFMLGGALAQQLWPGRRAGMVLLSPLLVAVVSYGFVLARYDTGAELLGAWHVMSDAWTHDPRLTGLAVCLPIHYASAAVSGCCLGIGMAHGLEAARKSVVTAEA